MAGNTGTRATIEDLTRAMESHKGAELTRLYIERAHCYEVLGDTTNSVSDFLAALETAESRSDIVHIRAMVALALAKKDEKEKALYWAINSVDEDTGNPEGHFTVALVCNLCGFLNVAIASLERVIALEPHHWQAIRVLGSCLRENGLIDKSIEILSKYVANNPEKPMGLYELAWSCHVCAFTESQLHRAAHLYETALGYNPTDELRSTIERKLIDIRGILKGHGVQDGKTELR